MKKNQLEIIIKKPIHNVFEFIVNPKNASRWMKEITSGRIDKSPPHLKSVYTFSDSEGNEYEYEVSSIKLNNLIELSQDWGYHVQFTLKSLKTDVTELNFCEWVDTGNLEEVEHMATLERIKKAVEAG